MEHIFIMTTTLFTETLPHNTKMLLDKFQDSVPSFLQEFYLSGGTALSLQLGHRESEDLDFFTRDNFRPEALQEILVTYGTLQQTELAKGTLNTFIQGVKLQFLEYPYVLIEPLVSWNTIQLSSVSDIACTKLQTIGMRGSKKDFIDIYFLLQRYSLDDLFLLLKKKYPMVEYSQTHILKSLIYFDDAESQPMPRMHKQVTWEDVKESMRNVIKEFQFV